MDILSRNDDFILPSEPNTSNPCELLNDNHALMTYLPVLGALSIACYAYLFWMYFVLKSPIFKRHPTTLAIFKCVFEVLFVQQFLWVPLLSSSSAYHDPASSPPYYCNATRLAALMSFLSQFALLGSELCFLIISVDLRKAYTNPFTSFKQNRVSYFFIVVGISVVMASLLVACGPQVYGMSRLGFFWIQPRRENREANYPQTLFYYLPSVAIFSYCIWANFQYYKGVEQGLSKTIGNRLSIMERSKRYTAAYVAYGVACFCIEFVSFLRKTTDNSVWPVPAFFYSLRGVWALVVIIYSNYQEATWDALHPFRLPQPQLLQEVARERLLLQPHLNTALRAEILYFATQGIMSAAMEAAEGVDASSELSSANADDAAYETRLFAYEVDTSSANATSAPSTATSASPKRESSNRYTSNDSGVSLRIYNDDATERATVTAGSATSRPSLFQSSQGQATHSGRVLVEAEAMQRIAQIEQVQSKRVSARYQTALLTELQALGGSGTDHNTNSSHLAPPDTASGTHNPLQQRPSSRMRTATQRQKWERDTPDTHCAEHLVSESDDGIELRNTFASQDSGADYGDDSSVASQDTVKWRETLDRDYRTASQSQSMSLPASNPKLGNFNPTTIVTSSSSSPAFEAVNISGKDNSGKLSPKEGSGWKRLRSSNVSTSMDSRSNSVNSNNNSAWFNNSGTNSNSRTMSDSSASSVSTASIFAGMSMGSRTTSQSSDAGSNNGNANSQQSHSQRLQSVNQLLQTAVQRARAALSPAHQDFRFKDFAPRLFAQIRAMHGISPSDYAAAFETTCRERFSEGRSGAFLFFSKDQRFIVKTMSEEECLSLRRILPQYVRHLDQLRDSLLVRFLGAHSLVMYGVQLWFCVMLNVFPLVPLSERYDLKGSWVNRHGNNHKNNRGNNNDFNNRRKRMREKKQLLQQRQLQREKLRKMKIRDMQNAPVDTRTDSDNIGNITNGHTYKDLEAADLSSDLELDLDLDVLEEKDAPLYQDNDLQLPIALETQATLRLAETLRKDITFLRDLNFMDYSLLIGVRRERYRVLQNEQRQQQQQQQQAHSQPEESIYNGSASHCESATTGSVDLGIANNNTNSISSVIAPVDISLRPTASSLPNVNGNISGSSSGSNPSGVSIPTRETSASLVSLYQSSASSPPTASAFTEGLHAAEVEGPGVYYLGVIDVLQQWDWKKRVERFLKINFRFVDGAGLSAIEPKQYCSRFWQRAVLDTFEGLEHLSDDPDVATGQLTYGLRSSHPSGGGSGGEGDDSLYSLHGEQGSLVHRGNAFVVSEQS